MRALAIATCATLIWCSTPGPSPAPPPKPAPEPGAPTCVDACANLAKLGCAEAKPTPDGATCVEVCQNADLPVACIAHALACDAANDCP